MHYELFVAIDARCTVYSSIDENGWQLDARYAEDGHRSDAVRRRRVSGTAESETLRNGQVSPMARHGMDSVRNVQVLQLEDGDAETRH